jgi:hypothetical protein
MDLEEQAAIMRVAEAYSGRGLVVVLGSPEPESAGVYAETVTTGDPTYAGPLAGVSLGLPVYHIMEDEIKQQVDPEVYRAQVALMELALDREAIIERVRALRAAAGGA